MSDILILPSGGGSGSDDCTATRAQLLSGYTGILSDTNDEPGAGTMVNRGAVSQSLPINGSYTIPQGYHNGSGKVTQSIPTQGGSTTTPGTAAKTIVAANRYVTGNIIVAGDANLVPGNIKKGVTIFGVQGTHSGYVPSATDLYLRGNNPAGFAVSGTQPRNPYTFQSGAIYVAGSYGYAIKYLLSASSYNLSSYTYVNFEFNNIAGDSTRFRVLDAEENILASAETTGTGSKTLSLDISSVNKTMRVGVYVYSDEMPSNTNAVQVYRIWLS